MCTRETGHTQTHVKSSTTNDHMKDHPANLTTIEGGATTVRNTPHARVGIYLCLSDSIFLVYRRPA